MIVAGCGPLISDAIKSLQNSTLVRRSFATAFAPQRLKLAFQAFEFYNALLHVTEMAGQKRIYLTTILLRRAPKSEQNPDFVQRHI